MENTNKYTYQLIHIIPRLERCPSHYIITTSLYKNHTIRLTTSQYFELGTQKQTIKSETHNQSHPGTRFTRAGDQKWPAIFTF